MAELSFHFSELYSVLPHPLAFTEFSVLVLLDFLIIVMICSFSELLAWSKADRQETRFTSVKTFLLKKSKSIPLLNSWWCLSTSKLPPAMCFLSPFFRVGNSNSICQTMARSMYKLHILVKICKYMKIAAEKSNDSFDTILCDTNG